MQFLGHYIALHCITSEWKGWNGVIGCGVCMGGRAGLCE